MKKVILASASPRRKELLAITGLEFEVEGSNYKEDMTLELHPHELAKQLSRGKAEDVAKQHKEGIVIGADTFIVFEGKILGKPYTEDEARKMLQEIKGKSHSVITGFTIIDIESNRVVSESVETTVYIKDLTDEEIESYVKTQEPLDKAGAYAIQGIGSMIVEKIEGDYFNVVGLPISKLADSLKDFDIKLL